MEKKRLWDGREVVMKSDRERWIDDGRECLVRHGVVCEDNMANPLHHSMRGTA